MFVDIKSDEGIHGARTRNSTGVTTLGRPAKVCRGTGQCWQLVILVASRRAFGQKPPIARMKAALLFPALPFAEPYKLAVSHLGKLYVRAPENRQGCQWAWAGVEAW